MFGTTKDSKGTTTEKGSTFRLILTGYVILSLLFIIWFAYSFFKNSVYAVGHQQGYQTAIAQLIDRAQNTCDPIEVVLHDAKVDMISIRCLQQASNQVEGEAETQEGVE